MTSPEPAGVYAITQTGITVECAFFPAGTEDVPMRGMVRRYRVVVEFPWEKLGLKQMNIVNWPDDVMFILDVPGLSEADAARFFGGVRWCEFPGSRS